MTKHKISISYLMHQLDNYYFSEYNKFGIQPSAQIEAIVKFSLNEEH